MALQSAFYFTDGSTRTFPSTKHIATKQHVGVYRKRVSDSTWELTSVEDFSIINNSIVFDVALDTAIYSEIEVRVADTANELEDSPSDIAIVAGIASDITTVATDIGNVDTVATNIGSVNTVSANDANVTTVATYIGNVNTTAGSIANVNTTASNIANVNTVAGISANVTTVATNNANVTTVANDISAVTTVANDLNEPISEIETVAGNIANVNTVGSGIANVNTVASNISNVNTTATNIANVNSVATTVVPNIAEILLADDNAITATAKALESQHWANYATDSAVPEGTGEFSAKHYSVKAGEYAASVNPSNLMHLTGNESASGIKTFTSGINAPQLVGFKNYIINGNFDVWQRATSQTSYGYGSDDRWSNVDVGSTKTHSQVACTDTERALFNASFFSRTVVSSVAGTNNVVTKTQQIEDVTKLAGKTITISFWAKADGNKNIQLALAQFFGTGGTPSSKSFVQMPIVALTSTWQKKTITVTIPSIVGKTLGTDGIHTSSTQIYFVFDAGINWLSTVTIGQQSGTFDIAQVQLEEGSIATPFEQRPIGLELSLCQRYYKVGTGTIKKHSTSVNHMGTQPFSIPLFMRVAPTMSFYKVGAITSANALEYSIDKDQMYIYGGIDYTAASVGDYTFFSFNASAEL